MQICLRFFDHDGSPRVEFCGYSAPHPSEKKINIRIQTNGRHPLKTPLFLGFLLLSSPAHDCPTLSCSAPDCSCLCLSHVCVLATGDITATEALREALVRLQQLSDDIQQRFKEKMIEKRQAEGVHRPHLFLSIYLSLYAPCVPPCPCLGLATPAYDVSLNEGVDEEEDQEEDQEEDA